MSVDAIYSRGPHHLIRDPATVDPTTVVPLQFQNTSQQQHLTKHNKTTSSGQVGLVPTSDNSIIRSQNPPNKTYHQNPKYSSESRGGAGGKQIPPGARNPPGAGLGKSYTNVPSGFHSNQDLKQNLKDSATLGLYSDQTYIKPDTAQSSVSLLAVHNLTNLSASNPNLNDSSPPGSRQKVPPKRFNSIAQNINYSDTENPAAFGSFNSNFGSKDSGGFRGFIIQRPSSPGPEGDIRTSAAGSKRSLEGVGGGGGVGGNRTSTREVASKSAAGKGVPRDPSKTAAVQVGDCVLLWSFQLALLTKKASSYGVLL